MGRRANVSSHWLFQCVAIIGAEGVRIKRLANVLMDLGWDLHLCRTRTLLLQIGLASWKFFFCGLLLPFCRSGADDFDVV